MDSGKRVPRTRDDGGQTRRGLDRGALASSCLAELPEADPALVEAAGQIFGHLK